MDKFIEEASIPVGTIFYNDPSNHPYVNKFFDSPNAKVLQLCVLNWRPIKELDSFQSTYKDVAKQSKGKGISFLLGDLPVLNFELDQPDEDHFKPKSCRYAD
ncbi:Protein disulfide isomerase-like 1-1 [Forsythia ovata]|uniref:Protein disulfide isomerase-like 1-1 n=1 Tax=Forsythia ovata TaxID=205694 RepID=A0ABD1USR4_9LAMI